MTSIGGQALRSVEVGVLRRGAVSRVEEAVASGDWEPVRLSMFAPRGTPPLELVQGVRDSLAGQRDAAAATLEGAGEARQNIEAQQREWQESTGVGR